MTHLSVSQEVVSFANSVHLTSIKIFNKNLEQKGVETRAEFGVVSLDPAFFWTVAKDRHQKELPLCVPGPQPSHGSRRTYRPVQWIPGQAGWPTQGTRGRKGELEFLGLEWPGSQLI